MNKFFCELIGGAFVVFAIYQAAAAMHGVDVVEQYFPVWLCVLAWFANFVARPVILAVSEGRDQILIDGMIDAAWILPMIALYVGKAPGLIACLLMYAFVIKPLKPRVFELVGER